MNFHIIYLFTIIYAWFHLLNGRLNADVRVHTQAYTYGMTYTNTLAIQLN